MNEADIPRITELIEEIKGSYVRFGGDVEFFDIKDEKVRIKTIGHCHS